MCIRLFVVVLGLSVSVLAQAETPAQWVNLGSNTGLFGFDWKGAGERGLNLAGSPQSLRRSMSKLKARRAEIADGAYVIFPLCPFSSVLPESYDKTPSASTHPLLSFDGMPTEKTLIGSRDGLVACWKRQFAIVDFDDPMTERNRDSYVKMVAFARDAIAWCKAQGLRPVFVYTPAAKCFDGVFSEKFFRAYVLDYIRDVAPDVPFLDYRQTPELRDDRNYANALFLNRTGCRRLTALTIRDVRRAFASGERSLSAEEFRDRMQGAWLGQSVGVAYGWPTEFKCKGRLVAEDKMPDWKPEKVNETFNQDDLYVEMTFIDTLARRGIGVTAREAGVDFANSAYRLWCANHNARNNLRNGIAAPASSHPAYHKTTDDIDYQIEADFSGILAPGLPQAAVDFGETFGRIMNYGDGLYAGQFVGAMYAEAYFETNRLRVVEKALRAIPAGSKYAEMVRDMLAWHAADPKDWKGGWRKAVAKYQSPEYVGKVSFPAIDVKINGAMVLLGLLYGDGDMDRTMYISTAGGYDSDCNPSSACGVLGTMLGLKRMDPKLLAALDRARKWEFTDYTWDKLNAVCERLVREIVVKYGGRIERDAAGVERLVVPEASVRPSALVDAVRPGPLPENVRLSAAERRQIRYRPCAQQGEKSRLIDAAADLL